MSIFSKLFKSGKPNVAKLKQARDLEGLRAALSYSSTKELSEKELSEQCQIHADAARALAELGDSRALPQLRKKLDELEDLGTFIRDNLEISSVPSVRERSKRDRAPINTACGTIRDAVRRLE